MSHSRIITAADLERDNVDCKQFVEYLYKDSVALWKQNFIVQSLFSKIQSIPTNISTTNSSTSILKNGQLIQCNIQLSQKGGNKENEVPEKGNSVEEAKFEKKDAPLDKRKSNSSAINQIHSSRYSFYCKECNKGFENSQGYYSHMHNSKRHGQMKTAKMKEKKQLLPQQTKRTKTLKLNKFSLPFIIDYEKENHYYFEFARQSIGAVGTLEKSVIVNINE